MVNTDQTGQKTAVGHGWDPKHNRLIRRSKDCGVNALRIKLLTLAHTLCLTATFFTENRHTSGGGVQTADPKCV